MNRRRRWNFCGEHSHRSITLAVMCMIQSGKWWTIMECDKFEKGADVSVRHPVAHFGEPLDADEVRDFNTSVIGVQIIDVHNIRMAMRALRRFEGSTVAAAAPRN